MRTLLKTLLLTSCLSLLFSGAFAASGPVTVNSDIHAGDSKAIRLKNLPKNAVVAVSVESDGEITVVVMDSTNYLQFPSNHRPLFVGQVKKRLGFSLTIPATDDYYLLLDNRTGREPRSVKVMVNAARSNADQLKSANNILRNFEQQLHKVFVFDPFYFGVKQCEGTRAFVEEGSGIVLCTEYLYHLHNSIKDKQMAQNALAFSIFHEVGRVLLSEWNHPLSTNEGIADEFATVLMVMVNQDDRAAEISKYFLENPSVHKALGKQLGDDRHPISEQTAQKILNWLKNPVFARKWQKVLVPHMQTTLLKRLYQHPTDWTDLPAVKKELEVRGKKYTRLYPGTALFKKNITYQAVLSF